jgi:hypothetical protein
MGICAMRNVDVHREIIPKNLISHRVNLTLVRKELFYRKMRNFLV